MYNGIMHAVSDFKILFALTLCFSLALVFGYITNRLKLSPILGYLLVGVFIGQVTPVPLIDQGLAAQLAEIGVILLMFGVGLHLNWHDLFKLKEIALPGAIIQTIIATALGTLFSMYHGWTIEAGLVFGMAIAVASTVVLTRILEDNKLLRTPSGHVAMGWLIAEDIITVLALVLLPALATPDPNDIVSSWDILISIIWVLFKISIFGILMFYVGSRVIPFLMKHIAKTHSRELFTLTVLAIAFVIAYTSAFVFGASLALGAFIAGLVVGESEVSHQAAANALPFRDAFAVLFFVSVGMLFNPALIIAHPALILAALAITLIAKPLTAFLIVVMLRKPVRTALVVAFSLAQIGEFSFIFAEEALRLNILPKEGYEALIICAIVSIAINPIIFRFWIPMERWIRSNKRLWTIINVEHDKRLEKTIALTRTRFIKPREQPHAIVIGYGYVGAKVVEILESTPFIPVIVDNNIDIVQELLKLKSHAIFGECDQPEILKAAGIDNAQLLVITVPDPHTSLLCMKHAQTLNPNVRIFARVKEVKDQASLHEFLASGIFVEEEEVAFALTRAILREIRGVKPHTGIRIS